MTIMTEHRVGASRHLRTVFAAGALGALADGALLERFRAGRGDVAHRPLFRDSLQ